MGIISPSKESGLITILNLYSTADYPHLEPFKLIQTNLNFQFVAHKTLTFYKGFRPIWQHPESLFQLGTPNQCLIIPKLVLISLFTKERNFHK